MKRKKILIIILAVFVIITGLCVFGTWYVNKIFIPVKLKAIVEEKLKENLNREVQIGKLNYIPFKGIIIDNPIIYEKDGKAYLLKADRVYFNILILPFLKQKTLIIPSIKIVSPKLNINRDAEGNFTFKDLIARQKTVMPQKKPLSVLIRRLNIRRGQISFMDKSVSPEFTTSVEGLSLLATFTLQKSVLFNTSFILKQGQQAIVASNGVFSPADKTLSMELEASNIQLNKFSAYYNKFVQLEINSGKSDFKTHIAIDKNKNLSLSLNSSVKDSSVLKEQLRISSDFEIDTKLSFDLDKPNLIKYQGSALIHNMDATGLAFVNKLEKVKGRIFFSNDLVSTDLLNGLCWSTPIAIKGKIEDFAKPKADIIIDTETIKIGAILENLPEKFKQNLKKVRLDGNARINIALKGDIGDLENLEIEGKGRLSDASINQEILSSPIKDINGEIVFEEDNLKVSELAGEFNQKKYILNAAVKNFAEPNIDAVLRSQDLILTAKFDVLDDFKQISISSLEGNFQNNPFQFSGSIQEFKDPSVNIYGNFKVGLEKIKGLNAQITKIFDEFNPQGEIGSEFMLEGRIKNPKEWKLDLKAASPNLNIKDMNLGALDIRLHQENGNIYVSKLNLNPYAGSLNISGQMDITQKDFPIEANLDISNIRLDRLIQDTKLKKKDVSGDMSAQAAFSGYAKDSSKLQGNGWFQIRDGKLFELPLLKGLSALLFSEPAEDVVFTSAGANFLIAQQKISTQDLQLLSRDITLTGVGSVGFDRSLDFLVSVELSKKFSKEPEFFGEIGKVIFETAKSLASQIKVTGTIDNPKFVPVPVAPEKLFKKKIFKPFEDIFEGTKDKKGSEDSEELEGIEKFKEIFFPKKK